MTLHPRSVAVTVLVVCAALAGRGELGAQELRISAGRGGLFGQRGTFANASIPFKWFPVSAAMTVNIGGSGFYGSTSTRRSDADRVAWGLGPVMAMTIHPGNRRLTGFVAATAQLMQTKVTDAIVLDGNLPPEDLNDQSGLAFGGEVGIRARMADRFSYFASYSVKRQSLLASAERSVNWWQVGGVFTFGTVR